MTKENVTTTTKKITLRVHPLTYGFLCSQAHLKASVRKASVSKEVAELLTQWAKGRLPGEGVVPSIATRVQVMGCVSPGTFAAINEEYNKRLKAWGGRDEEPSLSNVAGEILDRWFFSDYHNLPFREGDKMRRRGSL